MNFDREEKQSPQDFNVPKQSFYVPETPDSGVMDGGNFSIPNRISQEVDGNFEDLQSESVEPFVPPEYESNTPNSVNSLENNNSFEEREIVNWNAPDLLIGKKSKTWFLWFFVIVTILAGLSIWQQLWTFTALILVSAAAIFITRRDDQSSLIGYSLSTRGVYIGNSFHSYDEFKGFGIIEETNLYSIVFIPKKRFSPSTSIYFNKEDGEKITDIIGARLPMEEIDHDLIDRIIRKINL